MNIAGHLCPIGLRLYQDGFVPPSKQCAIALLSPIKSLRVESVEVTHAPAQLPLWRMQQEVVVVIHEAVGVRFDAESLVYLPKQGEKQLPM